MPRIMIVDDDIMIRKMLRITFEDEGFDVEEAPDGEIAIKLFDQAPVDLIIMDLIMPHKDGIETICDIQYKHPSVKIIAISGGIRNSPGSFLTVAERIGACRSFKKPVDRQQLIAAVQDELGITT
ncbi:MAG: response regulator [bacterium]|nr:response regulator [bacterium]